MRHQPISFLNNQITELSYGPLSKVEVIYELGQFVEVMSKCNKRRELNLASFLHWIKPAVIHRQYKFLKLSSDVGFTGYVIWAWVEAYTEAWKTHWVAGLCASPWFLLTAAQYIFPSSIILFGFMVAMGIWIPILIGVANIFVYLLLVRSYIKDFDLSSELSNRQVIKAPLYSALLESITWLPNLLGYSDEILGKKKGWLTR